MYIVSKMGLWHRFYANSLIFVLFSFCVCGVLFVRELSVLYLFCAYFVIGRYALKLPH
jgi:hypothetical protein